MESANHGGRLLAAVWDFTQYAYVEYPADQLEQRDVAGMRATSTCECNFEMENARGGKMRIALKGLDALAGLTTAFWRAP